MRKLLLILISFYVAFPAWAVQTPQVSIVDSFDRANTGPPPSASWTNIFGDGMKVVSNQLAYNSGGGGETLDYYNGLTSVKNVEAYVTIATRADFNMYWRLDSGATNAYFLEYQSAANNIVIHSYVASVDTTIGTYSSVGLANGDKIMIRHIGSTIETFKSVSGVWSSLGTINNAAYATGGRVGFYAANTTLRLDDLGVGEYKTGFLGLF